MTPPAGNGGEDGDNPTGGGDNGDQPATPAPPSSPPATSGSGRPDGTTKAGTYLGSFGFGDNGIFVIDADNDVSGLALTDGGAAQSIFGNVGGGDTFTGTLRVQTHDPSVPPTAGTFGPGRDPIESTGEYNLNFVPGQTIDGGNEASLTVAAPGQIMPATLESVAGSWQGEYHFADCATSAGGCRLVFDVTFDGTTVTGSSSVDDNAGTQSRLSPISGVVSEYGDVLLLSFDWTDFDVVRRYDGAVFFSPGNTGELVFLAETLAVPTGNPTLASLMSRAAP